MGVGFRGFAVTMKDTLGAAAAGLAFSNTIQVGFRFKG